ncbi:MAG: helix-turn-helix domain-containing protein [Eubacterium sp.]|nr:helix-turn-helix domain-containing protein [Eubacterium sp.]MBQ9061506.1 helix-turn-helix domain-containing protein [Eubacterium sp.]
MPENPSPGDKLRYYRRKAGLSEEELGAMMGRSDIFVKNMESGFVSIHEADACRYAEIFGIDPEELMDEYTNFCREGYGSRIARIRKLHGKTQKEFAEDLGITRCRLSIWESELYAFHPSREAFALLKKYMESAGADMNLLMTDPDSYADKYAAFISRDCGKKIRRIRLIYGMVLTDFAALIGCEEQTIEHWEIGISRPIRAFYNVIERLAEDVGIDIERLNEEPEYCSVDYLDFINASCGRKMASIRMAYGYGPDEMGELFGCTGEAVSKWERGMCVPELKYFRRIEEAAIRKGISIQILNEKPDLFSDGYLVFCESHYGRDIQRIRKAYHYRQDEFGKLLGVSMSTISNWETERFLPSRKNYNIIKELAAEKGVEIHDT